MISLEGLPEVVIRFAAECCDEHPLNLAHAARQEAAVRADAAAQALSESGNERERFSIAAVMIEQADGFIEFSERLERRLLAA